MFDLAHHCSDVTEASWHVKSPASRPLVQQLVQVNMKENIYAMHHWPFVRESTSHRLIPHTKGQLCKKGCMSCCHHDGNAPMTIDNFMRCEPDGLNTSHYSDVIMGAMASQITSLTIVYSTIYSDADKKNIKAPRHWPLCGENVSI